MRLILGKNVREGTGADHVKNRYLLASQQSWENHDLTLYHLPPDLSANPVFIANNPIKTENNRFASELAIRCFALPIRDGQMKPRLCLLSIEIKDDIIMEIRMGQDQWEHWENIFIEIVETLKENR